MATIRGGIVAILTLFLSAGTARVAAAQIPGESVFDSRRSVREEYRAMAFEEVKQAIAEWTENLNRRNLDEIRKSVAEGVYFAPLGWSVSGVASLADSLRLRLPDLGGFHFRLVDFDASGNIAYALADVSYHVVARGGREPAGDLTAEAIVVLYRSGARWKIRSYLERARGS